MRARLIPTGLLLIFALTAVSVVPALSSSTPRLGASPFEGAACPFEPPTGHAPECGWLTVPAIRGDASAGVISLPVAIFRSTEPEPRPDPLVYLAGGPGEHALEASRFLFDEAFAPFLAERDVILFDQRGAGLSEPSLRCPEVIAQSERDLGRQLTPDDAIEASHGAFAACRDRIVGDGTDLRAFTTAESAADVAELRRVLGYAEWNLLGISYGTRLAQTVLRDHPRGVRSVILDSAFPLEIDLFGGIYDGMDRAFTTLFDACAASTACDAAYPDLRSQLDNGFDLLTRTPVRSVVGNPLTGEEFPALHDGGALLEALFQGLYSSSIIPLLPELIADASTGEAGALDLLRGLSIANQAFLSAGMQITLQCAEEVAFTSRGELLSRASDVPYVERLLLASSGLGDDIVDLCAEWGAPGAAAEENRSVRSDVPVLVLGGTFDPITPPAGGRLVAGSLGNATFVEIPAAGHAVVADGGCPQRIAMAFLREPGEDVDTSCVDGVQPVRWALPLELTSFTPFQDPLFGIEGERPQGWIDQGLGVLSRTELGIVSLAQQRVPGLSVDETLGLIAAPLEQALGAPLEPAGSLDSATGVWEMFRLVSRGQAIVIALNERAGGIVIATGTASQRDDIVDWLLEPAVAAFRAL